MSHGGGLEFDLQELVNAYGLGGGVTHTARAEWCAAKCVSTSRT
jgi:hypothetical protein